MRSSGLLRVGVPLLILFTTVILLRHGNRSSEPKSSVIRDLTPQQLHDLGIDSDTPADTVATLVAQMKQYRQTLQQVNSDNQARQDENRRLHEQQQALETRINNRVHNNQESLKSELERRQQNLLDKLETELRSLAEKSRNDSSDIPPGLGLTPGETPAGVEDAVRWVEPLDAPAEQSTRVTLPTGFGRAGESGPQQSGHTDSPVPDIPVYTLPENATLTGSVAMTALIGRIPVNGSVSDPYPFKVLIGSSNLTANGIELPDIAGAVISGTASGDWTLSCVRGQIRSVTFVFHDGTVRTVPDSKNSSDDTRGIGWISDEQGLPCIPGARKSNAAQYLASQFLLSGSGAAAQAFANSQTTSMAEGSNITSAVTGNNGQFVLGQTLGGGLKDTAEWMKQHYGQTFDAIYVPPGHAIAVHITRQLAIDYAPAGRRVKYSNADPLPGGLD